MFSSFWDRVKEFFSNMFGYNQKIEETLHVMPAVSDKMVTAIDEWDAMYRNEAEWLREPSESDPTKVVSLGLPAFIASEKARMAVIELKSEITAPKSEERVANPDYFPPTADMFGNIRVSGQSKTIIKETVDGDTKRADYMNEQYQKKLISKLRAQLEYGIAKGSLIIKPYVVKSKVSGVAGVESDKQTKNTETYKYFMEFDFIQADCFYPIAFDGSGNLSDVAFIQTKVEGDITYTRLERHKRTGANVHIENYAFKQKNAPDLNQGIGNVSLGAPIPLTDVNEWKDIPQVVTIKNVDRLLFGYFKMPEANIIDPHSPLGMSGFGRARDLIRDADEQYSRLLWEFEGGELAIDIDRDALEFMNADNGGGHSVMPTHQKRLYRQIDLGESDTYRPFSPSLRDTSLINGLNNILMRIEDVCAMSRGTISDVSSEARTATEIKILRQRSFSANREIQSALQTALEDVVYAMNVYCTLYNIVGDIQRKEDGKIDTAKIGKYDVSFEWDDSILIDQESELNTRIALYNQGLEGKVALRMWYFGETEAQAQDALNKIAEEKREAIENNMMMSSAMGNEIRNGQTGDNGQAPDAQQPNAQQMMQMQQMQNAQREDTQEQTPQQQTQNI